MAKHWQKQVEEIYNENFDPQEDFPEIGIDLAEKISQKLIDIFIKSKDIGKSKPYTPESKTKGQEEIYDVVVNSEWNYLEKGWCEELFDSTFNVFLNWVSKNIKTIDDVITTDEDKLAKQINSLLDYTDKNKKIQKLCEKYCTKILESSFNIDEHTLNISFIYEFNAEVFEFYHRMLVAYKTIIWEQVYALVTNNMQLTTDRSNKLYNINLRYYLEVFGHYMSFVQDEMVDFISTINDELMEMAVDEMMNDMEMLESKINSDETPHLMA